jgi:hypothetical protein
MVNVLIGEGDVLQDGEKTLLPIEAFHEVMHGMESYQRVERPAVMAWGEV